jgi:DNA invertase Pin-like site-specific DNA recombinase
MALLGYARVSTQGQDLEPQLRELRAAGCATIFEEKASGTNRTRPELLRLLEKLRCGARTLGLLGEGHGQRRKHPGIVYTASPHFSH